MNGPILILYIITSFSIRQQWLTSGITNCMVFNFNDDNYDGDNDNTINIKMKMMTSH